MKYRKIVIILSFVLIILLIKIIESTHVFRNIQKNLDKLNLNNYNKLMIVAHPDDEMLWAGKELIKEKYLVVCITCGKNKKRANEFKNAMKKTNNEYLMLGYPDKIFGTRSRWFISSSFIKRDLTKIINYKNWKKIVTHNQKGEYGHIHHIKAHFIVSKLMRKYKKENLYVFGEYCSKNKILSKKCKVKKNNTEKEAYLIEEILRNSYYSQIKIIDKFKLMLQYEDIHEYKK